MMHINKNKIKTTSGYVGCSGVAAPDDPIFSKRATVCIGNGVVNGAADRDVGVGRNHSEVNVPDNPEFRAAYVKHLKKRGLTDEEIAFCLEFCSCDIKRGENYVAYCGGEVDPCAENVASMNTWQLHVGVERLRSRGYEPEEMFEKLV